MPFVTAEQTLPRSLDVQVSLSRPQAEVRTNLTILAACFENLGFLHDAARIRFYSTIAAVENDFAVGTDAWFAASAFFSQSPRATTMALGEVFLSDQAATMASAILSAAEILAVKAISDGSMDFDYNPDGGSGDSTEVLTGLDFSSVTTIANIATIIDTELSAGLTCVVKTLPGGDEILTIVTDTSGDGVTIELPVAGVAGTFVGGLLNFTAAQGGRAIDGYTSVGIGDELSSVANAAITGGENIYGWCLGTTLRTVEIQTAAAVWVLARTGIMSLVSNDANAKASTFTTDIGSVVYATNNQRVELRYHDNAQQYPDVSMMAYMLSVDYAQQDSTVTSKFKALPGVTTVEVSETEWIALQNKGYNVFASSGNSSELNRDGNMASSGYWYDSVVNLDNFAEDLTVNVFNVFLRRKKVPFTREGQLLLVEPCENTGNLYILNGTFADRRTQDATVKAGVRIIPAVQTIPTDISLSTAASRAARVGPPIEMIVQEAGAIHSVAIAVEVVQ